MARGRRAVPGRFRGGGASVVARFHGGGGLECLARRQGVVRADEIPAQLPPYADGSGPGCRRRAALREPGLLTWGKGGEKSRMIGLTEAGADD